MISAKGSGEGGEGGKRGESKGGRPEDGGGGEERMRRVVTLFIGVEIGGV